MSNSVKLKILFVFDLGLEIQKRKNTSCGHAKMLFVSIQVRGCQKENVEIDESDSWVHIEQHSQQGQVLRGFWDMKFVYGLFGSDETGEDTFSNYSWMYPYQRTPMGNPYISRI